MAEHIYVRPLRVPNEIEACQAAFERANADLPEKIFVEPSTAILVAEKSGRSVMYQPLYMRYLLGSIAPAEGVTDRELASAMHQMTACASYEAQKAHHGELLFVGGNLDTEAFALRHKYEPLEHRMFRLRLR